MKQLTVEQVLRSSRTVRGDFAILGERRLTEVLSIHEAHQYIDQSDKLEESIQSYIDDDYTKVRIYRVRTSDNMLLVANKKIPV